MSASVRGPACSAVLEGRNEQALPDGVSRFIARHDVEILTLRPTPESRPGVAASGVMSRVLQNTQGAATQSRRPPAPMRSLSMSSVQRGCEQLADARHYKRGY